MLFHASNLIYSNGYFDVVPDGEQFLILTSNYSPSTPLTLVTNWNSALKTKLGSQRAKRVQSLFMLARAYF
jgi:hypothetical protein